MSSAWKTPKGDGAEPPKGLFTALKIGRKDSNGGESLEARSKVAPRPTNISPLRIVRSSKDGAPRHGSPQRSSQAAELTVAPNATPYEYPKPTVVPVSPRPGPIVRSYTPSEASSARTSNSGDSFSKTKLAAEIERAKKLFEPEIVPRPISPSRQLLLDTAILTSTHIVSTERPRFEQLARSISPQRVPAASGTSPSRVDTLRGEGTEWRRRTPSQSSSPTSPRVAISPRAGDSGRHRSPLPAVRPEAASAPISSNAIGSATAALPAKSPLRTEGFNVSKSSTSNALFSATSIASSFSSASFNLNTSDRAISPRPSGQQSGSGSVASSTNSSMASSLTSSPGKERPFGRRGTDLLLALDEISVLLAERLRVPASDDPDQPAQAAAVLRRVSRAPELPSLENSTDRRFTLKGSNTSGSRRGGAGQATGSRSKRGTLSATSLYLSSDPFVRLPKVILLTVFSHLAVNDLLKASLVSTKWYQLIADYAPAVSAPRSARRNTENTLLNLTTFSVRVRLLDGSAVTGDFPSMHTVEQVKRDVFKQSSLLVALSKDSFFLALSPEEVLINEAALFMYSSDVITRMLQDKSDKLELHIIPKSAVTRRHASYMGDVPASSLIRQERRAPNPSKWDNAERTGFLLKSAPGTFSTSWTKRWCILTNNILCYFKRKEDSQPAGTIAMKECYELCAPVPAKKFSFEVKSRVRTYQFVASDNEDMNGWISSLNAAIGPSPTAERVTSPDWFKVNNKEGFLVKGAPELENWKRRWFVCKEGVLYYFKTPQDALPLGSIALRGSSVEVADDSLGKRNCFCVQTHYRRYVLVADSIKDMKDWMEWIERNLFWDSGTSLLSRNAVLSKARMVGIVCAETHMQTRSFLRVNQGGDFQIPSLSAPLRKMFGIPNMSYADSESKLFRCTVTARAARLRRADTADYTVLNSTQIINDPLPPTVPRNFILRFWWPDKTFSLIKCDINQTVVDAARQALKRQPSRGALQEYLLKVRSRCEYVTDLEATFGSLVFVRNTLKRGKKIHLCFVKRQAEKKLSAQVTTVNNVPDPETKLETCYPHSEIELPMSLRVIGIEVGAEELTRTLPRGEEALFFVEVEMYYGDRLLAPVLKTPKQVKPLWGHVLTSDIRISQMPQEAILCFTFWAQTRKEDIAIGWANCQLFDFEGRMKSSHQKLNLIASRERANPLRGPCTEVGNAQYVLRVEFPSSSTPIIYSLPRLTETPRGPLEMKPDESSRLQLTGLLAIDPFYHLSVEQKELLWQWRYYLRKEKPHGLARLVAAVTWTNTRQVAEVHKLLESWPLINPRYALALLVPQFADIRVRSFAIKCLNQLTDHQLGVYMLQLTSALKYEPYHDSPLARFLLTRALNNPYLIGQVLFWHLKAEMYKQEVAFRFGLILEAYLSVCGDQLDELAAQVELVDSLHAIAATAKVMPDREQRRPKVRAELAKLKFPASMRLPISPRFEVSGIIAEECKTLDSATVPLWLVFKNSDPLGKPISIIYKIGDDLRQDVITLQMVALMDSYWRVEGFDFHLTPYNVVSTGEKSGMIEVVLHSTTAAQIHKMYGGVTAALSKTPLFSWMREQSPSEAKLMTCVQNFTLSLVGYCIATYVIGIGDRHNDNIMIDKSGHLFHIDFSKFLGNRQLFAGFNRDKAPFVLTQEFVHVMGGEKSPNFENFIRLCCSAYNIIRKHVNFVFILFSMMLSTGIPELRCEEDLDYLRMSFGVDQTDEEAAKKFKELINESLNTKTTQINFAVHLLANPK